MPMNFQKVEPDFIKKVIIVSFRLGVAKCALLLGVANVHFVN
jgi:hypothetical protein